MKRKYFLIIKHALAGGLLLLGLNVNAQLPARVSGLRDNSIFGMSLGTSPSDASAAESMGVKWVRNGIDDDWSDWNNSQSQIDDMRNRIDTWHSHGVHVMPILWYPANMKPYCCGPNVPQNIGDYVNSATSYINALVDKEQNFEHWNEPWIGGWAWTDGSSDDYRNMINGIWDKVKPNHPEVNLLGGGSVAFNRDVMYVPGVGSSIGKCDGSISHGYGVPCAYQLGIHYTQMELDKKYSPTKGRAGAWQTEIGVSSSWFASDGDTWQARGVGTMYMTHWMAGFLANQPVKLFWFEYSAADGTNWQLGGKPAQTAYSVMTQIMEGTKINTVLYPTSKAVFGIVAENVNSNDTRSRAAVWANSIYGGDIGNPWDPQGNTNITTGVPSDMYSGTMSISGTGIQAYDYLGNQINDLNNITLNPLQVVYLISTQSPADLVASLNNANYRLKTECLVYPLSLNGLVVNGRTIDIQIENAVNKVRSGVLSITPPSGWSVSQNNIRFDNLQPGEKRIISFPISGFNTNTDNKYPMSYLLAIDGKSSAQTGASNLQVAYAPKKTITVDGNTSDWNGIVATNMGNGAYRFRTAWDDNYLYYEAEITDATHAPYDTWEKQKNGLGFDDGFMYANHDGVLMYLDCFKDNPDDLLRNSPFYEKGCASDVDYTYMASYTLSGTSELIRYRAPGTNNEGYYPLNQPTTPALGPVSSSLSTQKYWRPGDGKTYYEGAISWNEIPQMKTALTKLGANQVFNPNLAWQVNGGDAGNKYWTKECNILEDGAAGHLPMWEGEMVQAGGRIITRWSFVNGDGSAPVSNVCTGIPVTGVSVTSTSASVSAKNTVQLTAAIAPANACNPAVSWSSSNTAVATVSSSGLVTGVTAGTATITVTTVDGSKTATSAITVTPAAITGDGLKGDYFNNMTLSGTAAVSRVDATVDFDWDTGTYATGQPVDGFSTRWSGQVLAKYTETYTFETESDDGARLWVNGQQLVNAWVDQAATKASGSIALTAGQKYDIKYEYYENGGGAVAHLRWSSASQAYQVIPQAQLFSTGSTPVPVTGVTVTPASPSINVGATQQLTATVAPSNATNQAITWSSSNTAVATVSSSGLVTGVTAGTATITVKTTDGNKTATSAITVNPVTGCTASGTILYERWDGISGTAVSNLTSNANYPNTPTSSSSLTSMEAATDVADNYGARIAGYICAPATGAYTFWIASDDASQLWLSTDGTAANKVKIAEVTSWTNSREWGKQTSQKSATINLTQGQSYYVEALMKEGSGGDNLAVGWLKPGQSGTVPSEVVPGSVLSPLIIGTPVAVTGVSVSPTAPSIVAGNTQQLTATVAPSNATNTTVSWSSSNTAVATVNVSGLVTGVAAGTATITVKTTDGGKTATSAVTVTAPTISCTDEQGTVTCYKAASTITVDGNLNEASWCISNTITKTAFGTKNNTATFGVLYDNTNLYIGVKVLDANVFAANNTYPWENDGIELYIDPNNSGGTTYDSNDRQYIKAASTLALWANAGGTTGASVNWVTISGGYTMEFKIPFSLLGISSAPANNTLLGFDIGNDDDDNGSGRSTQISWNDATGNDYSNPSLFGKLKISSTVKDGEISASTAVAASGISVYPNPSDGTSLTLQGLSGKTTVNICSLTGSLVYNSTVYASGDVKLDGMNLKSGVYILSTINGDKNTNTVKLIVQKF